MKTYEKLEIDRGRYREIKNQLIKKRGNICAGCNTRQSGHNLTLCQIDDEGGRNEKNLVLLEDSCRTGILDARNIIAACNDRVRINGRPEWHKWVYGGQCRPN